MRLVKAVSFLALALCIAASTGCTTATRNQISAPVPFVTTPPGVVRAMLELADVTGSDIVYDLGSGDGRIVIAAARDFGARAVGVEIDPKLVQESERNAESAGVSRRVRFLQQDLFRADITEATVVTLFLLPGVNVILAPKLLKELRPGTRIVSYWYDMGEWQPDKTIRIDTLAVYYWVIPADVDGMWTLQVPTAEGIGPQMLSFRQAYQRISGSVRLNGRKLDLRDPRIDGERLSFTASGTVGGEPVLMRFSGQVQGGQAAGVVEVKGGAFAGSHQWVAQRSAK